MTLASLFYSFAYRFGRPRWDTGEPRPELKELVGDRPPGRALDIGCGTGTNAIYLAEHGWAVVGVDFVAKAIESAKEKVRRAGLAADFRVGDATRLREAGVRGPFDLLLDVGCYHGIPERLRDAYATEVAALARPGADFYLVGITDPPIVWRLLGSTGIKSGELTTRFGRDFDLASERTDPRDERSRFRSYHLIRRQPAPAQPGT